MIMNSKIVGVNILIVGGQGQYLGPALIQFNEDGSVRFEECGTEKYKGRSFAVSEFLENNFVICGGMENTDCNVIDESGSQSFDMAANGRIWAASVKLNQSTMWITGGVDSEYEILKSSEFVTIKGSTKGPNLLYPIQTHCIVQYKPNGFLLIGGDTGYGITKRIWIIEQKNEFNITEGPYLNYGRTLPSCGTVKDEFENVLIIVAGGGEDSIEILNTTTMTKWITGKTLIYAKILIVKSIMHYS